MKVIIKRPDERLGHEEDIDNTLEEFQRIVGGNIEAVHIGAGAVLICNEEGKLLDLDPSFWVWKPPFQDVICGTAIICGTAGEDFADVPITLQNWKKMLEIWGNRV